MSVDDIDELTRLLSFKEPATSEMFQVVRDQLEIDFPMDYIDFMGKSNGADGPIGESGYLSLWPIDKLVELNLGYRVKEFAPGLVLFGSDGGGEAFAFDNRSKPVQIVGVPFVGLSNNEARPISESFVGFLSALSRGMC